MNKKTRVQNRVMPKSLTVYFNDKNIELANEIERMAKEYNMSVSNLINMSLAAGTAIVRQDLAKMEYLKQPMKKSDAY